MPKLHSVHVTWLFYHTDQRYAIENSQNDKINIISDRKYKLTMRLARTARIIAGAPNAHFYVQPAGKTKNPPGWADFYVP